MSRLAGRLQVAPRAAANLLGARAKPVNPRRILVAHSLLLGDVLMLTPLIAKLRERYPQAGIAMTVRPAFAALFAGKPYGVEALHYDPADSRTLKNVLRHHPDLAFVPGDNRYSWLAAAAGARWIVAFAGDRPAYKSWAVDEEVQFPSRPMAWGDMAATLVEGPAPAPYRVSDWSPSCAPFELPKAPYAVLHVGASSPLRLWPDQSWLAVAAALEARGLTVVWSAGPGEAVPDAKRISYPGNLDLAQVWHLLAGAAGLITLDTGIAHMAKLVGVRTVALFGPGSPVLFGRGDFWRDVPFVEAGPADFPCRDQQTFFKRRIEWVRRCQRTPAECAAPRCMHAIGVEHVLAAAATAGFYAR
jgi:ADP-heptose:LPS heptosyltransferase